MSIVLALFAIVGFIVVARGLGTLVVAAFRRLFSIIPTLRSIMAFVLRQFAFVFFSVASLLTLVARNSFLAFRKAVTLIASTIEGCIRVVREPTFVRETAVKEIPIIPMNHGDFTTARAIAWCWFPPTCVMLIFLGLSERLNQERDFILEWIQATTKASHDTLTATDRVSQALDNSSFIPQSQVPGSPVAKPLWIIDGTTTSGDVKRLVLSSQLWSTVDEAKQELKAKAVAIVDADFASRHHQILDPIVHRVLSEDRFEQVAVKDRYVESVELDFGTMNRLWWQLEISPVVRTELYSHWKAAKVQNRMIAVGTGLALITLMASAGVLFTTLKRASTFGISRAIATTTGCLAVWSSACLFFATRLLF